MAPGQKRSHERASASETLPQAKKAKAAGDSGRRPSWKASKKGPGPGAGGGGGVGGAKALSRDDRAVLRRERRASKPHHALIADANALYRFDLRRMGVEERRAKVSEILSSTLGSVRELVVKHDTSRVYQLLCKHGTAAQRQQMLDACKGAFLSLSLDHYAHHFVLKLLQYSTPITRLEVWRELRGHLADVAFHIDGGVVFDYLWAAERSRRQQLSMLREMFHPTFALDAQTSLLPTAQQREQAEEKRQQSGQREREGEVGDELSSLCLQHPHLAGAITTHTAHLIDKALHKGVLQYRFIHCIIQQFLSLPSLSSAARSDVISSLCASPSLAALTGSGDGLLVLCHCVEWGAAKERKAVLRCVKAEPLLVVRAVHGHLLLTRLVQLVDDTVAVNRSLWQTALRDPAMASAFIDDVQGAKVVHAALTPPAASAAAAAATSAASQPPSPGGEGAAASATGGPSDVSTPVAASAAAALSGTSKKDRWVRYDEHLSFILLPLLSVFTLDEHALLHPPALAPAVLAARAADREEEEVTASTGPLPPQSLDSLLRSPAASAVLVDILHTAQSVLQRPPDTLRSSALASQRSAIEDAIRIAIERLTQSVVLSDEQLTPAAPHHTAQAGATDKSITHSASATPSAPTSSLPGSLLLQDRTAHYAFKRLLLLPTADKQSHHLASPAPAPTPPPSLLSRSLASSLLSTLQASSSLLRSTCTSNRGCFVLLALAAALEQQQQRTLRTAITEGGIDGQLLQLVGHATAGGGAEQPLSSKPGAASQQRKKRRTEAAQTGDGGRMDGGAGPVTGCRLLLDWLMQEGHSAQSSSYSSQPRPQSAAAAVQSAGREKSRGKAQVDSVDEQQRQPGPNGQEQRSSDREIRTAASGSRSRAASSGGRRGVEPR